MKTRLFYLDFLKGFAILLVILGHVIQYNINDPYNNIVFRYIYAFHMPLFMFISGFVSYKEKSKLKYIKKKGMSVAGSLFCLADCFQFAV